MLSGSKSKGMEDTEYTMEDTEYMMEESEDTKEAALQQTLQDALLNNSTEIVESICQNLPENEKFSILADTTVSMRGDDLSALSLAVFQNNIAIVRVMLKKLTPQQIVELISYTDTVDFTALHWAVYRENAAMIKELLANLTPEQLYKLVTYSNNARNTPLDLAMGCTYSARSSHSIIIMQELLAFIALPVKSYEQVRNLTSLLNSKKLDCKSPSRNYSKDTVEYCKKAKEMIYASIEAYDKYVKQDLLFKQLKNGQKVDVQFDFDA